MVGRPPKPQRTYPNRLREIRAAKGLTLEEVAERVRMRAGTVGKYETGSLQLKVAQLDLFAQALGVPVPRLLSGVDPAQDEREAALLDIMRRLSPDEQRRLLKLAIALLPERAAS